MGGSHSRTASQFSSALMQEIKPVIIHESLTPHPYSEVDVNSKGYTGLKLISMGNLGHTSDWFYKHFVPGTQELLPQESGKIVLRTHIAGKGNVIMLTCIFQPSLGMSYSPLSKSSLQW